jgi:hypothetical protein
MYEVKKVILGALAGGVVSFVWMCISWGILPFHHAGVSSFENEERVARVLQENTYNSGVYFLPIVAIKTLGKNIHEDEELIRDQKKAVKKNPVVFMQINKQGIDDASVSTFFVSFLIQCLSIGFVAYLLTLLKLSSSFLTRFYFAVLYGLSASLFFLEPGFSWFGAGFTYTIMMVIEAVINWALVGLTLAAIVKPRFDPKQTL